MAPIIANGDLGHVRFIPLRYDNNDSEASALKLIHTLKPDWASGDSHVEFVRFTDGITNTLLKAVNRRSGLTKEEIDREAILLRAYGNGTAVLIDRDREAANHELLMRYKLAPDLLARFENGMLYRFIPGTPCQAKDLQDPAVYLGVASRLAEWHATVPCLIDPPRQATANGVEDSANPNGKSQKAMIANIAPGKPTPNVWTVMQKWILALPTDTLKQREKQAVLQRELEEIVVQLSKRPGLGRDGLVFAHCDLLCANVIMHPDSAGERTGSGVSAMPVSFIDFEYATPSPAAFDVANHFAEWVGYDCDYASVPSIAQRHAFVKQYIETYSKLSGEPLDKEAETRKLMDEVDTFRGVPGFYWGIWALIQATISQIDFDYANYAELRLGEYWDYKAEVDGSRVAAGKDAPLREKTWAKSE